MSTLKPSDVVEKVVVPERDCRCGGRFMVLQIQGERGPRVMHKKPVCPQFTKLGPAFLNWVSAGEELPPPSEPKPNRRMRRAIARQARRDKT